MSKKQLWLLFCILGVLCTGIPLYKKKNQLFLAYEIKKGKPSWAEEQIRSDFAPFIQKGISQAALDETFKKIEASNATAYRYRIIDGKIYRKGKIPPSDRPPTFEKILRRLHRTIPLPNLDFIVCTMDGVPEEYVPKDYWLIDNPSLQAPLLAWAKKEWAQYVVLIPDHITTIENSWQHDIATINQNYKSVPWTSRIEKVCWRGTASDKRYREDNYLEKPRYRLCDHSVKAPHLVDAGFCATHVPSLTQLFTQTGHLKGTATLSEQLQYKYLPVLDGWMCTYPGYQWRLLSGSLTLKQESDEIQYFYRALKPYVHYLPIKNDMSDLLEKIEWAKTHDEECRAIASNGRAFALQNLMPNKIYAYFYWVLQTYASLQTSDPAHLKLETERSPEWKNLSL